MELNVTSFYREFEKQIVFQSSSLYYIRNVLTIFNLKLITHPLDARCTANNRKY